MRHDLTHFESPPNEALHPTRLIARPFGGRRSETTGLFSEALHVDREAGSYDLPSALLIPERSCFDGARSVASSRSVMPGLERRIL